MRHLQAGTSEAAFDVEAFVGLATVEDALVAANFVGDVIECLDQAETKLLALLILGDCNIFDVSNVSEAVNAVRRGSWVSQDIPIA